MNLKGKTVLITGGVRRVGRVLALAVANRGGNLILHYNRSIQTAQKTQAEAQSLGVDVHLLQADFSDLAQVSQLIPKAADRGPLYALVNSAAIFKSLDLANTTLADWEQHMAINLTAPFLLCQGFAKHIQTGHEGRIVNILDWRALSQDPNHLPYTISKSGLAALTRSLAVSLAPHVTVNGLALGAVLPPNNGGDTSHILDRVPMQRWAYLDEIGEALLFLLEGPTYITGEILHIDGGRHLG